MLVINKTCFFMAQPPFVANVRKIGVCEAGTETGLSAAKPIDTPSIYASIPRKVQLISNEVKNTSRNEYERTTL